MSISLTRHGYDVVAERYAVEIGDELAGKPLDRALLTMLGELSGDGPILELGAGPGHIGKYLLGSGADVICSDLSPAMCAIAGKHARAVAADMTAVPVRSSSIAGLVCLYAVIHLESAERGAAYAEMARVLRPDGHALVSFHTADADARVGEAVRMSTWWGHDVELTFRFLDPVEEVAAATDAGLDVVARLDRAPYAGIEHASQRCYLLLRRRAT